MENLDFKEDIFPSLFQISREAGKKILSVYNSTQIDIQRKEDQTPVTEADLQAHHIISKGLRESSPWPIHSEEEVIPWATRKEWTTFWLVDPLDGTKSFIKKTGEFTVNIALIENGEATLGVIYQPTTGILWHAAKRKGAYRDNNLIKNENQDGELMAIASKNHLSQKTKDFLHQNGIGKTKNFGSSIKFCYLAQGDVDVYPRFSPTSEWDTAAGQIICEEAGCQMIDSVTQQPMRYNKENILNNSFVACRSNVCLEF